MLSLINIFLSSVQGSDVAVLQRVDEVTACCKVMLQKCQSVQIELDTSLQESTSQLRPENFYQRSYSRALGMVNQVTNLTDAVTLLAQVSEPIMHGEFIVTLFHFNN